MFNINHLCKAISRISLRTSFNSIKTPVFTSYKYLSLDNSNVPMSSTQPKENYKRRNKTIDWRKAKKNRNDKTSEDDVNNLTDGDAPIESENKVPAPSNDKPLTAESGLDAVTSYRNMPYLKQLRKKRGDVVKSLRRIHREITDAYRKANKANKEANIAEGFGWTDAVSDLPYSNAGYVCPLGSVMESPTLQGYRNKNEFSLGVGIDGQKTAGFQCGRYQDGESRIGSPAGVLSAPECATRVAALMDEFMRNHEFGKQFGVWDKMSHTGFYRMVCVRNSTALGQLMVSVQVNSDFIEGGAKGELFQQFKKEVAEFFVSKTYGGNLGPAKAAAGGYALPEFTADLSGYAITEEGAAFAKETGHSLTSLLVQEFNGISNAASDDCPVHTVFGASLIHDVISGLTFQVNLYSFFQVNVKGAEILYAKAAQWALAPAHDFDMPMEAILDRYCPNSPNYRERVAELVAELKAFTKKEKALKLAAMQAEGGDAVVAEVEEDDEEVEVTEFRAPTHNYPVEPLSDVPSAEHADKTLLLDICCGTGTIGLIMSKTVRKTVGLELVPAAIEDAKVNAALNKITNASFVCGKAEDTIKNVMIQHAGEMDMAVGIVDPPRGGLHNDVVRALRMSKLKRIVYVSCNAATLADNVTRLCGLPSKRYPGEAFVPICAAAVDMFPHTPHCEAIMLLERRPIPRTEAVIPGKEAKELTDARLAKEAEGKMAEKAAKAAKVADEVKEEESDKVEDTI